MTTPTPIICGRCRKPIELGETGLRHFGSFTAHSENRCIELLKADLAAALVALRAELASVKADAWRAATILAHNICIQESDRINAEDGSIEAMDAISECAKRIREWAEPSPEQLNEMLGESRAAHPKDAP